MMKTSELQKYDRRLRSLRSELLGEISRLRQSTVEDIASESDLSDVPTHNADHDSEALQANIGIEKTEAHLLNQVDEAMLRVEQGTFGQCVDCGKEIPAERLEELPYAARCVDCAASREAKEV
jgi:RNA polymerase-binding protein DksA